MPRENQKRGRRAQEKKRKHEDEDADDEPDSKKVKSFTEQEFVPLAEPWNGVSEDGVAGSSATPFYGNLDQREQEYFKHADDMLELNQFPNAEERDVFLNNVYREADGKELKIANSQSCSRLMERLIQVSGPDQLKMLFQKFSGHFLHLVQHRFASHCCEALFIRSAPIVTQELLLASKKSIAPPADPNAVTESMENLFLYTLNELEGNLGYLMTDRFASHALRVLLLVLSGEPLTERSSIVKSKRKEKVSINGFSSETNLHLDERKVPESFALAAGKIISDTVLGLDTNYLRVLATHHTGNPTLQLLLQLELTKFGKQRAKNEDSLIRKLLPDEPIIEGTESASFINGILYDPVGSRLLETIVAFAPGRTFKALYKEIFRERLATFARNEVAGYVVCKVLERLGKDDLQDAAKSLAPNIEDLVERNRIVVIRVLIERSLIRGCDTSEISAHLESAYASPEGFDIAKLLHVDKPSVADGEKDSKSLEPPSERMHESLLAQTMLSVPGQLSDLVFDAFLRAGNEGCIQIAKDPTASRALQAAITSPNASIIFRRKVIQQFYGNIGEMALDSSASHVIDAIWEGTRGLAFIRERVAEELAENEASLRESHIGRAVWRNWKMDLYKRRRADWVRHSRTTVGNERFQSFPDGEQQEEERPQAKSKIELARERHAAAKTHKRIRLGKRQKEEPE
ncbi:ARM repeat-containing protein [Viridothelium virens]|uniref:Nucleolar protein 9 n=1 Tax=Viridothelium virens TaxID=1048519 RepID=A0A6A6HH39_VIRVR|nr:ARM repeat-containing protein [Viridothelium virens]